MRSLRYLIMRKACSFDDCLDLCQRERPKKITIELEWEERLLEFDLLSCMIGCFTWEFPSCTVENRQVYGIYALSDSEKKKHRLIAKANFCLATKLEMLDRRGFKVCGKGVSTFITR